MRMKFGFHLDVQIDCIFNRPDCNNFTDAIDMTCHKMTSKSAVCSHRPLQVHTTSGIQCEKRSSFKRFRHDVRDEFGFRKLGYGETYAIDGYAISYLYVR